MNLVQTRSEVTGLSYHTSLCKALEAAKKDETIWKISFSIRMAESLTEERVILDKSPAGKWIYRIDPFYEKTSY